MKLFAPIRLLVVALIATRAALICPVIAQEGPAVILPAAEGIIVGTSAKLAANKSIEAWTNPSDWVKWTTNISIPGIYNVIMEYGYGGATGSVVEVAIGDQGLHFHVVGTEGWENYATVYLGQVEIKRAGIIPVNLTVLERHGAWIMNLRAIRLVRTNATTLEEPAQRAVHPAVP